ncbi:hypothetical protein CH267_15190 [Rhodococcus sp. 06-621-2]|nr:hypothetical protein CH267_15190 [Rhodococcus sp. 06-621-2]
MDVSSTVICPYQLDRGGRTMPKIGRFSSEKDSRRFTDVYDAIADRWPVPSTSVDVDTSFGSTYVRRSGTGEGLPIVVLPGIGGNSLVWGRFIEALAHDHVVYTPDVIGWAGRCKQTAPVRNSEDVARWLVEVMDGLGERRFHLAGNSAGAWLAACVAVHQPERPASLAMLEPSAAVFARPRIGLLLKFLWAGIAPTEKRMRKLNEWLQPRTVLSDEEYALALAAVKFRMAMPWDRTFTDAELGAITAPSLVLFGAETVVADPNLAAARARRHIRSVDVGFYEGVGHDLMWANPDEVIPRFLAFTDSHDPVRA